MVAAQNCILQAIQSPGADIMTTLNNIASFSPLRSRKSPDFVSTDTAALESHMNHCASTRSRFFGLKAALESAHSMFFPRMVTLAIAGVAILCLAGVV